MKKLVFLVMVLALIIPTTVFAYSPESNLGSVKIENGPRFWIKNVDRGESVTVGVKDFPDGKTFNVYLVRPGTDFQQGTRVGSLSYLRGESFSQTFEMPKEVRSLTHIAIYIWDSTDNSLGYDIFANDTGFNSNMLMSFVPIHRSSAQSAGKSVEIFNGPTLWIEESGYPKSFNIVFENFYGEGSYSVYIGSNNASFQGILVGFADENPGTKFTKSYDIPNELKNYDTLKVKVEEAFNGHSGSMAFRYVQGYPSVTPYGFFSNTYLGSSGGTAASKATPFTKVLNVVPDTEVTLQVFNLPADKDFIVTMGPMGTRGINGYVIGTQNSGEGGSFIVTYPIPDQLHGSEMISIRLESTSSGHFAYDYFKNSEGYSAENPDPDLNPDWKLSTGTYPLTNIVSVVEGDSVTVAGSNFTINDEYTVRMGVFGTRGVGGIIVNTYSTNDSSSFSVTFTIPDSLKNLSRIAIRFESMNSPYYAFDWFYNSTFP